MTEIKKLPDWRARLAAAVESRRRIPFLETNNCGVFLADCVAAMVGADPLGSLRGRTRAESLATLRRAGFPDFPTYLASMFEEIHPSRAVAGDIMAFPTDETGWAAGIVGGERVTVLSLAGLGTVSRSLGKKAFRIPSPPPTGGRRRTAAARPPRRTPR